MIPDPLSSTPSTTSSREAPLLRVRGLRAVSGPLGSPVTLLDGVDLEVGAGEIVGLVGESGSGKTLTILSVLDLLPPGVRRAGGTIEVADLGDPATADRRALRRLRGGVAALVFQDPQAALNPVLTIGRHLVETLRCHHAGLSRRAARERAVELLERVALPDPSARLGAYPHQLSGGQRQRALLALALAGEPRILLADEPTTALDVTIQAQVLRLLLDLRDELGLALVLVTHDLAVIAQTCDRVAVMDAGRVVESTSTERLFASPAHPRTRELLEAARETAARETAARETTQPGGSS